MSRKTRKVYRRVEELIAGWLAAPPPPVAATLEEFKARAEFSMLDEMVLIRLYRLLADTQKSWDTDDGVVAKRLRDISGIVASFFQEFEDEDAAVSVYQKTLHNRELLSKVSWIMATPPSPDELPAERP